jgi:hypothetical protein
MDQHPYDGKTRHFRHDDPDPTEGHAIVLGRLGIMLRDLSYELSFYSGGVGVIDHVAITGAIHASAFEALAGRLGAMRVEEGLLDPEWGEDLGWLLDCESRWPWEAAVDFVVRHRRPFLPGRDANTPIRFVHNSDVND